MPPILTDAECDKFVSWIDEETATVEKLKYGYETLRDDLMVARLRTESAGLRLVAFRLCAQKIAETATQG